MRLVIYFLFIVSLALVVSKAGLPPADRSAINVKTSVSSLHARARLQAARIRDFARDGGYDTTYCLLADMSLHSGKNRFLLYRLDLDSVVAAGLVTHGSGSDRLMGRKKYSNQPNSNCTSLGRYSIGNAYQGKFGLAYKLHGLDPGNSLAFKRYVVLHAHDCVPDSEVYPLPICLSLGCPTVSPAFLQKIRRVIDQAERPMLLHIYD